jgi:hypothetical protein
MSTYSSTNDDVLMFEVLNDFELREARGLMNPGVYQFEVSNATRKTSQSGNPMLELTLKIYDSQGKTHAHFDWLVATKNMTWKTKRFLESIGLGDKYNSGQLSTHECIGKSGLCKTDIEKDKKGEERSVIKDYLVIEAPKEINATVAKEKEPFFDDDIKF